MAYWDLLPSSCAESFRCELLGVSVEVQSNLPQRPGVSSWFGTYFSGLLMRNGQSSPTEPTESAWGFIRRSAYSAEDGTSEPLKGVSLP